MNTKSKQKKQKAIKTTNTTKIDFIRQKSDFKTKSGIQIQQPSDHKDLPHHRMQSKSQHEPSQFDIRPRSQITTVERKNHTLLRINADDFSTKHMVIFWVCYVSLVVLISCLTLALPKTFVTVDNRDMLQNTELQGCLNPTGFDPNNMVICNPISKNNSMAGLLLRKMSNKNQFLFVYINLVIDNKAQTIIDIPPTNVTLQYYEIGQREGGRGPEFYKINEMQNQQTQFRMKPSEGYRVYEGNGYGLKGYKKYFGYKKYIEEENSLIHFKFNSWPLDNVKDVYLEVETISPEFTVFAIVYRYLLFALSLSTTVAYFLRYRLIPDHLVSLEQKMVLYLSIFTVMFNDPLYPATILAPNGFTYFLFLSRAFCSVAFVVNFLTFLMAFWMILVERILYQAGEQFENVISKKKITYFVAFYISMFTLQFQVALLRFNDQPMLFDDDIKSGGIIAFEIISFLIFAGGLTYIAVQYVRSAMEFFNKIWRNQMFLVFSFIFFLVISIMLVINGFSVYEYAGNRILILFGFMNMYTVYLQYMYSINEAQVQKMQREKILGTGDVSRNEVETVISNFGGEEIMVDLDSELSEQGQYHSDNKNPNQVKKYANNINERIESRDEQQNEVQENTMDHLHEKKNKEQEQEMYSLED